MKEGRHWKVGGSGNQVTVEIFGFHGMKECKVSGGVVVPLKDKYDFFADADGLLGAMLHQMSLSDIAVSGEIGKAIRDRRDRREIEYVIISSRWAVFLWLEQKLKLSDLEAAAEDDDSILLTLEFGGKEYQVVVIDSDEIDYNLAFTFVEGEDES